VREFLARDSSKALTFEFEDVRKQPVSREDTIALVRTFRVAVGKKGSKLVELDPKKATDDQIASVFLGTSGTLRAPTLSVDDRIMGGWDEALFTSWLK
jgi:hypothetical protein